MVLGGCIIGKVFMNNLLFGSYFGGVATGLIFLWLAGDYVVHYAVELATALRVTKFFIGFMVLAIAAGIPELALAITAAFSGATQVSAGDVIGANFSDVAFVTGIVLTVAGSITLKRSDRIKLIQVLAITAAVMGCAFIAGAVGRLLGFLLIIFYCLALFFIRKNKANHGIWHDEIEAIAQDIKTNKDAVLTSVFGLTIKLLVSIGIVLGCSWLVVYCAMELANSFGAKLETIGATICAIGTSLPELAMSLTALKRKESELALAPTLGSVLEHSTLALGMLGLCSHTPVSFAALHGAGIFMFVGFALMIFFLWLARPLARWQGVLLLAFYGLYLTYECGWLCKYG
jgi:cation:H+ antiporter